MERKWKEREQKEDSTLMEGDKQEEERKGGRGSGLIWARGRLFEQTGIA